MNGSSEGMNRIKSTIERLSQTFNAMAGLNELKDNNKRKALIEQLKSEGKELNNILGSAFPVTNNKAEEKEDTSLKEETPNDNFTVVKIKKSSRDSVSNILNNVYEKASSMKSVDASDSSSLQEGGKVLVLKSSTLPIKIDPLLTVAVRLFGEKYRWLGEILVGNHPVWSKKWYVKVYNLIGIPCLILPFLTLYKVLPSWYALLFIWTCPMTIMDGIFPLNWTLFKMLCFRFETIFSFYCVLGSCITCMVLFDDYKISVFFGGLIIICFVALVLDAKPDIKERKKEAYKEIFALLVFDILIWHFGLFLNFFKIENIHQEFTFGIVNFAWAAFGLSCWQTYICFKLRIIYNGFVDPSNMVVLNSKLQLQSMRESEVNVLIATSSPSSLITTQENI